MKKWNNRGFFQDFSCKIVVTISFLLQKMIISLGDKIIIYKK